MGGGAAIVAANDSAIIFNVEGEPVFSSGGVDIGPSLLPAGGTVARGHLVDPKGNTVTDKKTIMDQITEWSAGGTATVVGTTSRFYNTAGYVFVVEGVSTNVGISIGASWTRYLGTKEEVIAS